MERLLQFDISVEHIAGNNLKLTDNPIKNPKPSQTGWQLRRMIRKLNINQAC